MKTIFFTLLVALSLSACNDQKPPPEDINKNMTMPSTDPRSGYTGKPNKY